jgi:ribokinase
MGQLLVIGCINWDINLFLNRFPQIGEEVTITKIKRVPGGTAANVAVAASRLMEKQEVTLIGGIGADEVGRTQLSVLKAEGINISGIQTFSDEESGQAYIVIDDQGQNCIHTYFGANRCILPQFIRDPTIMDLIKAAEVIVIMDPPLSTALKVAELGKANDSLIIWDPGVYCELGIDALSPTLAYTDYFILNQIEFTTLLNTSEPKRIGQRLATLNANIAAIVKQGARGCTLIKEQGEFTTFVPSINLLAIEMKVVNTVGCGDAFIGAFAAAKLKGREDEAALIQANYVGAYKATREETRGSPTRDALHAFINYTRNKYQEIV